MFDPLSTRRGRLTTFCLLYVTEGIPTGFAATAVVTEMQRQDVSSDAIATFLSMLYLPWGFKWLIGPVVDLVYSDRLGRRRAWIVGAQVLMAGTLLAGMPIDLASRVGLLTWLILIHAVFAATQDVAIDALAVGTLNESERGMANGLMFAGAYVGNGIGGAGSLFLSAWVGFQATFLFAAALILAVTFGVTIWIRERREPRLAEAAEPGAPPRPSVAASITAYLRTLGRAMLGTPAARAALVVAVLPAGAYSLSLALQSTLAVQMRMNNTAIGWMTVASTVLAAAGCVAGGAISDRFGRRRSLAIFVGATAVPTVCLAVVLQSYGWVWRVNVKAAGAPVPPHALLMAFWAATLAFSLANGLMYGARSALFMDLTDSKIGATQFTAYMALLNLVIVYSTKWQGWSIERLGYPITLAADAAFGCVGIAFLPWCARAARDEPPKAGFPVLPAAAEPAFTPPP